MIGFLQRRLVLVVRADPVICGHAGEARNLAEAALLRGFTDVTIITWPIERLVASGLPLKPLDGIAPYSPGITVERPEPIGDHKVPDGRYLAGLTGRLIELFTDGIPTVCISLYLSPHTMAVDDAVRAARATGLPVKVSTIAEAVGSDVTNVVRSCVEQNRFGAAAHVLSAYLSSDAPVAVSEYTRQLIISAAEDTDRRYGTRFAGQCRQRVSVSYPAISTAEFLESDPGHLHHVLSRRGLEEGRYVLFLSRLVHAKGVEDLIHGFEVCPEAADRILVIAGNGPQAGLLHALADVSPAADRIRFLHDVDDDERRPLMAGSAAFVLPSKPRPEFTETFGIALVEKMLSGGGPVITTETGGIGEAVGDTAMIIPTDDPSAIAAALRSALTMSASEQAALALRARTYALQFDRMHVFDKLMEHLADTPAEEATAL